MSDKLPFDLAKAIAGHPLVTRDGRTPSGFHRFSNVTDTYTCCFVLDGDIHTCTDGGKFDTGRDTSVDLFLAPTEVTMWQSIYKRYDGGYYTTGFLWHTKELAEADRDEDNIAIATVPVTFNTWKP